MEKNLVTYAPKKQTTRRGALNTRCLLAPAAALAVVLCANVPACALPFPCACASARADYGLFPKIRYPKINVGKGAKAVLYPVTKTTVNSGKAVVGGGKAVVKGGAAAAKDAQKGLEIYETERSLSSKVGGAAGLAHLK